MPVLPFLLLLAFVRVQSEQCQPKCIVKDATAQENAMGRREREEKKRKPLIRKEDTAGREGES